jgi:cobalt-zinc-cadmium efflux system protein
MSRHHAPERPPGDALDRRLWLSAGLNVGITLAELVGGLLSGSLALLSDAVHNLSDVSTLGITIWTRRLGRRPASARYTYGLRRAEVLAALANAIVLIVVSALIGWQALVRLLSPTPVKQSIMLSVALVALVANFASALLLERHSDEDVNVRSAFLHLAQDTLASLAVVIAALLAGTRFGPYVDPAAALVVSFAVLRSVLSLLWETVSTLLEASPAHLDVEVIAMRVEERFVPAKLHHLHLWEVGPGQRVLTAHVGVAPEMNGQAIEALFRSIKALLREEWGVTHSTLEPEVEGCGDHESPVSRGRDHW